MQGSFGRLSIYKGPYKPRKAVDSLDKGSSFFSSVVTGRNPHCLSQQNSQRRILPSSQSDSQNDTRTIVLQEDDELVYQKFRGL